MEDTRLGAILLENGVIPEETLEQCLEIQALTGGQRRLGEILVEQGALTERTLRELLAIQRGRRGRTTEPIFVDGEDGDRFIRAAVAAGANELILSEARVPQARIGGELRALGDQPLAGPEVWQFVREHLGESVLEDIAERHAISRALDCSDMARGRISAFRHFDGLAVVVRLHPAEVRQPSELGIDDRIVEALQGGKGLLLLAGEQGAGVTETMASLLGVAAKVPERSIEVLDKTFEYSMPEGPAMVTMRRVGHHTPDLESGMRVALQDADVIFLGDVDRGSFDLALHAAEVGVLVVAVVRARSTAEALKRVVRFHPPYEAGRVRSGLASSLRAVLAVQTVPTADHRSACLATETLIVDDGVRDLLRIGSFSRLRALQRARAGECGHDMDTALSQLVDDGRVRFEDAFQYAEDKARLLHAGWLDGDED